MVIIIVIVIAIIVIVIAIISGRKNEEFDEKKEANWNIINRGRKNGSCFLLSPCRVSRNCSGIRKGIYDTSLLPFIIVYKSI